MKNTSTNRRAIALIISALSLSGLAASAEEIYLYDPALGTFPTNQGFTLCLGNGACGDTDFGSSAPTLANGIFYQYLRSDHGYQFWHTSSGQFNFVSDTYVLEATVRIDKAGNGDNHSSGDPIFGFGFAVIDADGYQVNAYLTTNAARITAGTTIGPAVSFSNNAFHTFRVEIAEGTASLFIDGARLSSVPVGSPTHPDLPNYCYFGDGSRGGTCEVALRKFRFTQECPTTSLRIDQLGRSAIISWALAGPHTMLESSTNLHGEAWASVADVPYAVAGRYYITNEMAGAARFYRLRCQ